MPIPKFMRELMKQVEGYLAKPKNESRGQLTRYSPFGRDDLRVVVSVQVCGCWI
jgi:hypothetical protein